MPYGHPAAPFSDGIYSGLTKIRNKATEAEDSTNSTEPDSLGA
ncbi:hypothetical protein [Neisseria meningitidis]|nr:hypothetical protein [Neisseria meningitidis]